MAYAFYRVAGVTAPKANHARVSFNAAGRGTYYRTMLNLQTVSDRASVFGAIVARTNCGWCDVHADLCPGQLGPCGLADQLWPKSGADERTNVRSEQLANACH